MPNTANGLPYPQLNDSNNPPADIQALALKVDTIYGGNVANFAALPASGDFIGQRKWLVDVKRFATWNGTVWETDGAWITPTLLNSWVSFDNGAVYEIPQYTKAGRFVVLKGLMKSGTGIAFTLPAGYRPLKRRQFITANAAGARTSFIEVSANGDVNVAAFGTGASNAGVSIEFSFVAEQ